MARDVHRLFLAIALDEAARLAVVRRMRALGELPGGEAVRWIAPENLHVTLRFLGDVEQPALPGLVEAVKRATAVVPAFELRLGGVKIFPSRRKPVAVALELGPELPLRGLAGAVERGVQGIGFPAEERRFRPHLTLGRIRRGGSGSFPEPSTQLAAPLDVGLEVRGVALFESELLPQGPRYTVLTEFPLSVRVGG